MCVPAFEGPEFQPNVIFIFVEDGRRKGGLDAGVLENSWAQIQGAMLRSDEYTRLDRR
jgi:hypothetical protein